MAFTPGGRADKFGNRYESLWVANRLLDVLSENKLRSVTVEAIGEREDGVDLWVEDFDGNRIGEQCKARNGSKEKWSLFDLKNVITKIPVHVSSGNKKKFSLVTPLPFYLLSDLCMDARNSDDAEQYYEAIVGSSKDKQALFSKFSEVLSFNEEEEGDREKAYYCLKHFNIEYYQDTDKTLEDLKLRALWFFTGNSESLVSLLRTYLIDEGMLGKEITAEPLLNYLAKNEIYRKPIVDDHRLSAALDVLKSNFNNSISNILINDNLIKREETEACFRMLDQSDIIILHGEAGRGKSGVLYEFIEKLQENNISCLPIKLDRNIPRGSTKAFGIQLGLPDSPSNCLAKYSGKRRSVLILDQLDAIRWTCENSIESIDICKQLIKEVMAFNKFENGDLKVVIVCRTFDLENDPEIKSWLSNKSDMQQFEKLEVGELNEKIVSSIVGSKYQDFSEGQVRILRNPQNLYMWLELKDEEDVTFLNTADLMRKFWKYKRSKIEKSGISNEQINVILNKITSYMEKTGEITVPERVIDGLSVEGSSALLSNSIIQEQNARLSFCHQSYLDYLIAEKVFNEIDNGGSVLNWLGEKGEQTLYRRQQLSIFLFLLMKESQTKFVNIAKEILFSPAVRFHIKHLVFEVFSQVYDISEESNKLLNDLINSEDWKKHVLKVSVIGNPSLVEQMAGSGLLESWLKTDENISNGLQVISSVVPKASHVVESLLIAAYRKGLISKEQAYNCLSFHIADDTKSLFEFRMSLIKDGASPGYIDWKGLAERNPSYTLAIVKLLGELYESAEDFDSVYDKQMYDHDLKPIFDTVSGQFREIWDQLFDKSAAILKNYNEENNFSRYNSFDLEETYGSRKSYLDNFPNLCVLLLIEAGKKMAELYPNDLIFTIEEKKKRGESLGDNVLALIYLSLPQKYSDFVMRWLISDSSRLSLGKGFKRPQWMLASDLLKKFSETCDYKLFREIEDCLYTFSPSNEEFKNEYRYHIEVSRKGYFFPAWGVAQYFLMPSLKSERTSKKTKNLIVVLERKFNQYSKNRFFSGFSGRGGVIGSKLEPNIDKISDNSWVKIITNNRTSNDHDHSSWVQVNKDTVHVSSHNIFSGTLERAAKKDPRRFCRIFWNLPETIHPSYVSSMLSALSLVKPESNKNMVEGDDWEKASRTSVEEFWKKYRGNRFRGEVARSFCRLIRARNNEKWSQWVIEDLIELALKHEDPEVEKLNVWSEGETLANASSRSLHSTTINSVRGTAIEAIGSLLWEDKELVDLVDKHIQSFLNDPHPSIMIAIQSIALPMLNIDKERALDWFLKSCSKDIRVACTRESVNFINYTMASKDERLIIIIKKMLDAKEDEVVEIASEMVAFYSHCYSGIFRCELEEIKNASLSNKKGIVKAAKNLVKNDKFAFEARDLLSFYFNDSNKEVRDMASRVFMDNNFLNTPENLNLAFGYIKSTAFLDGDAHLFRCLEEYRGSLVEFSELILSACNQMLKSLEALPGESYSIRYDQKNFVTLLIRLYDQVENDVKTRDKCLDTWDLFFKENIDMTRAITKVITR